MLMPKYIPEKLIPYIDPAKLVTKAASFECEFLTEELLEKLIKAAQAKKKVENLSNSNIIFAMGLSENYNALEPCSYNVSGAGPDIDTDFSPAGRDQLVSMLQEKYGYDHVARVTSVKPWAMKESIVAFTKAQGRTHTEGRNISEKIPEGEHGKHYTWAGKGGRKGLKDLPEMQTVIKKHANVFMPAAHMDDQPKTNSIHACAVIMSPEPLWHQIPTRKDLGKHAPDKGTDKFLITQYEGEELEKMGFVKFDLLVLDTLDILSETCRLIGKDYYQYLEKEIPLNDPKAFKLINDGFTAGLFQIEEGHVSPIIQKCKPTKIEHISDISALIRPGPTKAGLTKAYIEYRQTGDTQNTLTPKLNKALAETGGVMVYQEQVMAALRILAGMDLATADQVRRAMGKKEERSHGKIRRDLQQRIY
jgi:DNA polymerase-3 subunit alpha